MSSKICKETFYSTIQNKKEPQKKYMARMRVMGMDGTVGFYIGCLVHFNGTGLHSQPVKNRFLKVNS